MANRHHRLGGNPLLTVEQVVKIRELARVRLPSGRLAYSAAAITEMLREWTGLALSSEAIRRVIRRETWNHVPDVETPAEAEAAMAPTTSLAEKAALEASALRMFQFQEEMRGQRLLDELTGEPTKKEEGK